MSDLIERLRKAPTFCGCGGFDADVCVEAADEIERLNGIIDQLNANRDWVYPRQGLELAQAKADNERLIAALREICSTEKRFTNHGYNIAMKALETNDE